MLKGMKGSGGTLLVGGRPAAALTDWSFEGGADGWTLTAKTSGRDDYWLEGSGPFVLKLQFGTRQWRWRNVAVTVAPDELTITGTGEAEKI